MTRPLATACALALLLGACGYDATPPDRAPDDAASPPATGSAPVAAADNTPLLDVAGEASPYLSDASGAALYFLEGDNDGRGCDDACRQVWPPVMAASATPAASPRLAQASVATLQAPDGHHVTYHGHPLYRYAGDRGARTTTGHGVEDEWGRWQLMGADGRAAQPSAGRQDGSTRNE